MTVAAKTAELESEGFCVLSRQFSIPLITACRDAFWPILVGYLEEHRESPNRGRHRHYLPMPFHHPCFAHEFFFDPDVLGVVRGLLGEKIVADQWGCDVPLRGSQYQEPHVDYERPLFPERPDVLLPAYLLVVSFSLVPIGHACGPIEIAPGTHRMPKQQALQAVRCGVLKMRSVPLELGDVLIRHPWAVHRGTPNTTEVPRALLSIRYARHWYVDGSREVNRVPGQTWRSLACEQQSLLRFPLEGPGPAS